MKKINREIKNGREITNVRIRVLKRCEIPKAAAVYALAWRKANVGEEWTGATAEKFFEYFLRRQRDLFFVAVYKGKVVGGIVGDIVPWWDGPHLSDTEIFVHPKFQRRGIARLLLLAILKKAIRKYQINTLEGFADVKSRFPLEWYNRIGWERTRWVHIAGDPKKMLEKLQ